MPFQPLLIFSLFFLLSCNNPNNTNPGITESITTPTILENDKNSFKKINEIPLPQGFHSVFGSDSNFAKFLGNIQLNADKTVYLFNGQKKANQSAQFAVLDISVGTQDLQQCADAIMRLRAEYFYANKQYDKIIFSDNEHKKYIFRAPYTRPNFDKYLNLVFAMCGTASLSEKLKKVEDFNTIQTGDVLIRGGFPGHAELVVATAENAKGEKIFLLAQSYMPAQNIHILKNPMDENFSPWYRANGSDLIETPEYSFYKKELKRF